LLRVIGETGRRWIFRLQPFDHLVLMFSRKKGAGYFTGIILRRTYSGGIFFDPKYILLKWAAFPHMNIYVHLRSSPAFRTGQAWLKEYSNY